MISSDSFRHEIWPPLLAGYYGNHEIILGTKLGFESFLKTIGFAAVSGLTVLNYEISFEHRFPRGRSADFHFNYIPSLAPSPVSSISVRRPGERKGPPRWDVACLSRSTAHGESRSALCRLDASSLVEEVALVRYRDWGDVAYPGGIYDMTWIRTLIVGWSCVWCPRCGHSFRPSSMFRIS